MIPYVMFIYWKILWKEKVVKKQCAPNADPKLYIFGMVCLGANQAPQMKFWNICYSVIFLLCSCSTSTLSMLLKSYWPYSRSTGGCGGSVQGLWSLSAYRDEVVCEAHKWWSGGRKFCGFSIRACSIANVFSLFGWPLMEVSFTMNFWHSSKEMAFNFFICVLVWLSNVPQFGWSFKNYLHALTQSCTPLKFWFEL